jgi:hypothetical protein
MRLDLTDEEEVALLKELNPDPPTSLKPLYGREICAWQPGRYYLSGNSFLAPTGRLFAIP